MLDLLRLQLTTFIMNDVPTPYACYFQDSATPNQEGILELHDNIMFYLLVILGLVSWMLYTIVITYSKILLHINILNMDKLLKLFEQFFQL